MVQVRATAADRQGSRLACCLASMLQVEGRLQLYPRILSVIITVGTFGCKKSDSVVFACPFLTEAVGSLSAAYTCQCTVTALSLQLTLSRCKWLRSDQLGGWYGLGLHAAVFTSGLIINHGAWLSQLSQVKCHDVSMRMQCRMSRFVKHV